MNGYVDTRTASLPYLDGYFEIKISTGYKDISPLIGAGELFAHALERIGSDIRRMTRLDITNVEGVHGHWSEEFDGIRYSIAVRYAPKSDDKPSQTPPNEVAMQMIKKSIKMLSDRIEALYALRMITVTYYANMYYGFNDKSSGTAVAIPRPGSRRPPFDWRHPVLSLQRLFFDAVDDLFRETMSIGEPSMLQDKPHSVHHVMLILPQYVWPPEALKYMRSQPQDADDNKSDNS